MATKEDVSRSEQRLNAHIGSLEETLEEQLGLIQDAIAETMTHHNQRMQAKLQDLEQRLEHLEQGAA